MQKHNSQSKKIYDIITIVACASSTEEKSAFVEVWLCRDCRKIVIDY
jgi:hypothetical protein